MLDARGGYTVHPVPAPFSIKADITRRITAGGISQSPRLLIRGKAISGAPNINGTSQFPNPPIKIGRTTKNIIRRPWAVIKQL